jgi:hypothetical protein
MIKVIDGNNTYYYDSAADVREDYPDADIHGSVVIIKEQASA